MTLLQIVLMYTKPIFQENKYFLFGSRDANVSHLAALLCRSTALLKGQKSPLETRKISTNLSILWSTAPVWFKAKY